MHVHVMHAHTVHAYILFVCDIPTCKLPLLKAVVTKSTQCQIHSFFKSTLQKISFSCVIVVCSWVPILGTVNSGGDQSSVFPFGVAGKDVIIFFIICLFKIVIKEFFNSKQENDVFPAIGHTARNN
jgi:hypothetical protein